MLGFLIGVQAMAPSPNFIVLALAAAATALALASACGGSTSTTASDGGTSPSSGTARAKGVNTCPAFPKTCPPAEDDAYRGCVNAACADVYPTCLGPDWKNGNFS